MITRKPETLPETLVRIAREHCFNATVDSTDAVLVEIPYTHLETRTDGIEIVPVRTLRQLKIALGY